MVQKEGEQNKKERDVHVFSPREQRDDLRYQHRLLFNFLIVLTSCNYTARRSMEVYQQGEMPFTKGWVFFEGGGVGGVYEFLYGCLINFLISPCTIVQYDLLFLFTVS